MNPNDMLFDRVNVEKRMKQVKKPTAPIVLSSDSEEEEAPKGILDELEEEFEKEEKPAKRRKLAKIDPNVITVDSSEEEESEQKSEDSDILECKELFVAGNKVGQRWAPPKKELKLRPPRKIEERNLLVPDLRVRNMAMPNPNLKSGPRHPIPVKIDRSVAEFFYKRDLVPRGYKFEENMRLRDTNVSKLVMRTQGIKFSVNFFVQQLHDLMYLSYEGMNEFSRTSILDMRDKKREHFGIPPFPEEFLCGCDCEDGCLTMKCPCKRRTVIQNSSKREAKKFDEEYWENAESKDHIGYDPETGLLTESSFDPNSTTNILPTTSIYECNKSCKCHDRSVVYCYNSMTSKVNCRYKTEIFLTTDKGWGYRAAEDIPAGAYITEYTGAVQPLATYFDPTEPSTKIPMNKENAVEMLDHFFRESLSLVEDEYNDGSKGELNKFDKEMARCNLKVNCKSVRNYEFQVDPVCDIINKFREKNKKNPLDWLATKHEGESPWNVEDKYEEEPIKSDGKNSSQLMKLYAYDQAYYQGFSMDASAYGNEARFMNSCCKPEYSNIKIVLIYDNRQDQRFPKICFFTLKDVKAGEEFQYDYGWGDYKKYDCNCNGCKNEKK